MTTPCAHCGKEFAKVTSQKYCGKPCYKAGSAAQRRIQGQQSYARNRDSRKARVRAWYQENRAQVAEANRAYRAKNAEAIRERKTLYKYGITTAEYAALFEAQGGLCAICGGVEKDKRGRAMPVDHCHRTGKVRGLLCSQCNQGIGMFYDDPERLKKAIEYLARHA